MSRTFRVIIILVFAAVLIQMFAVGLNYGRKRSIQPTTLGYSAEQIDEVRGGNHTWTDSLVTRSLAFYNTVSKDSAYKQIKIVQACDSGYWLAYHAEGYMRAVDREMERSTELMSKSLELNLDCERYINYAGDTFTVAQAFLYIAEEYVRRGDEYSRHFAEECVVAAMEEGSRACWQDKVQAKGLRSELETKSGH